ncbi:hypothetical protein L7F22_052331 [Adiantum nelumboides]|nr:hypothetical protein [Adiantum nelumboides]
MEGNRGDGRKVEPQVGSQGGRPGDGGDRSGDGSMLGTVVDGKKNNFKDFLAQFWESVAKTGHYANNCPQKKRPADSEDKEDRKGKRSMAGLVPDMVGDKPNSDASELCRAWGKVRDQSVLIFFDPGAKANFISPELASRLGIRSEEMGYTAEAGLACPGHTEVVTPIIGKLRLHIQSYVDAEEFYIMPLDGCDVLLGIPWLFRVQGILDAYNKKITVQSRGKTLILDVKLKGESIPTVSASAISSVMKKHLSAYLVFARMDALKAAGNEAVRQGNYSAAIDLYMKALSSIDEKMVDDIAALHSNCSFAHLKMGQLSEALDEANKCISAKPDWSKQG